MTTFSDNNQQKATEIGASVTLRRIVMGVIQRTPDHSMNEYFDLLQFGIDFVREKLRLFHEASIEVAYLTPNEAGIISFPSDMVGYTKIGIPINGQLWTLTVNDDMLLNRAQKCGIDIRQVLNTNNFPIPQDGYFFADHFRGDNYISGLYGIGGGFNTAYYRVDTKMRQIQFDGVIPQSEIVMEYKSSGISAGAIIGPQAIASTRTYIQAERADCDPRASEAEKARRWKRHDEEVAMMRDFDNMFTLSEFEDMMYSTTGQAPKR